MTATVDKSAAESAVRPFTIEIPQADLEDLRSRIAATRWPEKETVDDQSQGVPLATMQAVARYWHDKYDWRRCEAKLNAVPQFVTEIDGLDIHFVHVRSQHENALPLVVCHGWPGSFIEQMKIVDLLTNPTAHGGSAADAFHVVIPNMPGYGFSGKPATSGWDPARIGRAWVTLMKRLGYTKFVAAGGDWGGVVVDVMAGGRDEPSTPEPAPPELLGIHTNFAGVVPPAIDKGAQIGSPIPAGLSDDERRTAEQLGDLYPYAIGLMMGLRPQTLYGLTDSPVFLAAFILDHDPASQQMITRAFAGQQEGLSRDDVLDNITLFWLTRTGVSASRLYWESKFSYVAVKNVTVPVAVSVFPDEIYQAPRSWAEQAYPNLIHYNRVERGGHFAAWEQPELYASELRAGFRSLR
ncbi:epoxide hydrolase family protein [Actinoplanes sp. NPDC051513]|uniref:epoxide hydrolase family protein n=1 Tax=Actinoplanes sp. NPDC051513 TaxID=3363908 RepID=UPI0037A3A671